MSEVSDLIYHLLVLLVARGVSLDQIREELVGDAENERRNEELLAFAVELARGAGDITLKYFRKNAGDDYEN